MTGNRQAQSASHCRVLAATRRSIARLGGDRPKGIADVKAVPAVQIENERVIVTEWTFAPGAEMGQHVHGLDYVVVPLTSGTLRLVEPEGSRDAHLTAGVSYSRPAGVNHNVINVNCS
jgi:quercetin dioxygenase-like cupin family protein